MISSTASAAVKKPPCRKAITLTVEGNGCTQDEALKDLRDNVAFIGSIICNKRKGCPVENPKCQLNHVIEMGPLECAPTPDPNCPGGQGFTCRQRYTFDCQCFPRG